MLPLQPMERPAAADMGQLPQQNRDRAFVCCGTTGVAVVVGLICLTLMVLAFAGVAPKAVRLYAFGILVSMIPIGLMGLRETDTVAVYITSAVGARVFAMLCGGFVLEALLYVETTDETCPFGSKVQCGNGYLIALLNAFNDPLTVAGLLSNLRRSPEAQSFCSTVRACPGWARARYGPFRGTLLALLLPEVDPPPLPSPRHLLLSSPHPRHQVPWTHMIALQGGFRRT